MSKLGTMNIVTSDFVRFIFGPTNSGKTLTAVKMAVQAFSKAKTNGKKINIFAVDPVKDITRVFEIPALRERCGATEEFERSIRLFDGNWPIKDTVEVLMEELPIKEGNFLILADGLSFEGSLKLCQRVQELLDVRNFSKVRIITTVGTRV